MAVLTVAAVLVATLAWKGFRFVFHRPPNSNPAQVSVANSGPRPGYLWQREVIESVEAATAKARSDNITEAEMAVDRAASLIETARVEAKKPGLDFFEVATAALDGTLRTHSTNQRLVEHVTLARIELAQLRSALTGVEDAPGLAAKSDSVKAETVEANAAPAGLGSGGVHRPSSDGHIEIGIPRNIAADHVFGPAAAGGNWVDAKMMPESAEVLLPPATRLLVDDVRVQDLTIEGAAQTLDGIHWKNVTFIGTRVRYEGGETDLHNVHFVRCTFGFSTDDRSGRLASAIALGQSSIVIN